MNLSGNVILIARRVGRRARTARHERAVPGSSGRTIKRWIWKRKSLRNSSPATTSGNLPRAWQAMSGQPRHATSYGDDLWTTRASQAFASCLKPTWSCSSSSTARGQFAALASLCQSYHGVICCDQAHVETDECGAPEFFSNGSKLLVAEA